MEGTSDPAPCSMDHGQHVMSASQSQALQIENQMLKTAYLGLQQQSIALQNKCSRLKGRNEELERSLSFALVKAN